MIKTKVKEKQEAREEYKEAVSNRHTAVLLEETKQDIFEIKVKRAECSSICSACLQNQSVSFIHYVFSFPGNLNIQSFCNELKSKGLDKQI